jgi:hypothetical protein
MLEQSLNGLRRGRYLALIFLLIVSSGCQGTATVGDTGNGSSDVDAIGFNDSGTTGADTNEDSEKASDVIDDSALPETDSDNKPERDPDRTIDTLKEALAVNDLESGEILKVRGRHKVEDGGGGFFRVTESGCEADGGTCFIPNMHLAEADEEVGKLGGGSVKLSEDDLAWREFQIRYGPDDEDVIGILDLHGTNYRHSAENRPLVSFEEGTVGWDGAWRFFAPLRDIEGTWNRSKNIVSYRYATSPVRLERITDRPRVRPEWWGAPRKSTSESPQNASPHILWSLQAARQIYEEKNTEWAYVDLKGVFYYREGFPIPGGVMLRGVGKNNSDGYTKGTLTLMPGEAMYQLHDSHRKGGQYDFDADARKRVHEGLAHRRISMTNDYKAEKIGIKDLQIDGNVDENMHVFNNMDEYGNSNIGVGRWLQDSGDWCGFYTKGFDAFQVPDEMLIELNDVNIVDQGASGIAIGTDGEHIPQVKTSGTVRVKDTYRNHLLYGLTGTSEVDGLVLEGQYWGGNPLHDSRGTDQAPTYTDLTIRNIERGLFDYNTIIGIRGGGMTVDTFEIDLSNSRKKQGSPVNIIAAQDTANTFRDGVIRGYGPDNYLENNTPTIFNFRGFNGKYSEPTVFEDIRIVNEGTPMDIYDSGGPPPRSLRFVDVTYESSEDVNAPMSQPLRWGTDPKTRAQYPPRAWRLFHKNLRIEHPFNETFTIKAGLEEKPPFHPVDAYFVGGSIENRPKWNGLLETNQFDVYDDFEPDGIRAARVFLNDFKLKSKVGDSNANWHRDMRPGNVARLRDVTDTQGHVSDASGTFTTTKSEEGQKHVLVETNLMSRPWERMANTSSDSPEVTSIQVANEDGSVRSDDNRSESDPYLKVQLSRAIRDGETVTIDWEARVTPLEDYQTTGLFVARELPEKQYKLDDGPYQIDLRGVASSQVSRKRIQYSVSGGGDAVNASVQQDGYTLDIEPSKTGRTQLSVTARLEGVGRAKEVFTVQISDS